MPDHLHNPAAIRHTPVPLAGAAERLFDPIGPRSPSLLRLPYEKKPWFAAEWALPWAPDPPTAPTAKPCALHCSATNMAHSKKVSRRSK